MARTKARRRPRVHRDPVPRHEQQYCSAGGWLFDVEHAHRLIRAQPRSLVLIDVQTWARLYGLDGNPKSRITPGPSFDALHALTVDLTRPLILAAVPTTSGGRCTLLIDGTHRLARGFIEGVETLPAWLLSTDETDAITRIRP